MKLEFRCAFITISVILIMISGGVSALPDPISIAMVYDVDSDSTYPIIEQTIFPLYSSTLNILHYDISLSDELIEPENSFVKSTALGMTFGRVSDGILTPTHILSIYNFLNNEDQNNWVNSDTIRSGFFQHQYSNETIKMGKKFGANGIGICLDYSHLIAALIVANGGHARIVLTENHAYPEVYLGRVGVNGDIEDILNPFIQYWEPHFQTYYHIDTNQDVWLNMDLTEIPDRVGGPFTHASTAEVDWIDVGFATRDPLWNDYARIP